jgi:integrase
MSSAHWLRSLLGRACEAASCATSPSTACTLHFLRRDVTIDRQLVDVDKNAPVWEPPKTEASYRTVPLPNVVLEALQQHLTAYNVEPDGLLFTLGGLPTSRQTFGHQWRTPARAAGIPSGQGLHALRHYYASLLIRHGESVKTVQARLGHASAAETLDTYSHLWPDSDDRTQDAVDAVLGANSQDPRRQA